MSPSSPGVIRLFLGLVLVLLATLTMYTVWNTGLHYRYVSVNSIAHQDLSTHSYGIVVDAGSSSSKVHLFHWPPHNGDPHSLLDIKPLTDEYGDPLSKKVEPGIATFPTPESAFTSLVPLLSFASTHIPAHKHSDSVLYVMGTAGMRLLSTESQDRMVKHFTDALNEYPFHLPKDGIQVISGKFEGVFSWITINYLLGHFSPESHTHSDTDSTEYSIHTVGVMDMGGASLQIAFEVQQQAQVGSDDIIDINLGCGVGDSAHKHRVYTRTYLGYGGNTAREKYYQKLARTHLAALNNSGHNQSFGSNNKNAVTVRDPCTQHGLIENVTVDKGSVLVKGLGDFSTCKSALMNLLEDEAETLNNSGSSMEQGFDRPPARLDYSSLEFYGTSEFWYTMRDVLRMGGAYSATEFETKSSEFCKTDWRLVSDRFSKQLYTYADYNRLKSQCLKSSWLSVILHDALLFPANSLSLKTASMVKAQSVQWPLGALLYYTRYRPLREVQQQQFKSTQASNWELSKVANSSFTLPLLVVLSVVILLLVCRHRHSSPLLSPGSNLRFPRTFSKASSLMTHRRSTSVAQVPVESHSELNWIV